MFTARFSDTEVKWFYEGKRCNSEFAIYSIVHRISPHAFHVLWSKTSAQWSRPLRVTRNELVKPQPRLRKFIIGYNISTETLLNRLGYFSAPPLDYLNNIIQLAETIELPLTTSQAEEELEWLKNRPYY